MANTWAYDADRPDVWTWLQSWYVLHCDGDWEHGEGIRIDTLDNPGWQVQISIEGTELRSLPFEPVDLHRSEDDWCVAAVKNGVFNAACGPSNLAEALHVFRAWATMPRA